MIDKIILGHEHIKSNNHAVSSSDFTSNTKREVGGVLFMFLEITKFYGFR